MVHLVRFIVWTTGTVVIAYFILNYFGYEINRDLFDQRQTECLELLRQCRQDIIDNGVNEALACDYRCVNSDDWKTLIRKKH
jgi:hypothetical protein